MNHPRAVSILLCVAAAAWLAGYAAAEAPAPPPPVFDALLGGARVTEPLADLAARVPLARDQDFALALLGRSEQTSHHVAALRGAEKPHRHDRHDQLVVIVRGQGTQRVGDQTVPVGPGSVLFVPKGTVHAFTNTSGEPSIALLVYSPPFDGKDRVQVP